MNAADDTAPDAPTPEAAKQNMVRTKFSLGGAA